jgi:hypothetical protein
MIVDGAVEVGTERCGVRCGGLLAVADQINLLRPPVFVALIGMPALSCARRTR